MKADFISFLTILNGIHQLWVSLDRVGGKAGKWEGRKLKKPQDRIWSGYGVHIYLQ